VVGYVWWPQVQAQGSGELETLHLVASGTGAGRWGAGDPMFGSLRHRVRAVGSWRPYV